jgi:RNA polymerase sigma-B factor
VLVARYRGLVRACANRYRASPEPTEDLIQVGYLGLIKAINNFDPDIGAQPGGVRAAVHRRGDQALLPRQALARAYRAAGAGAAAAGPGVFASAGAAAWPPPSDGDLAEHLGVGEDAICDARQAHLLMQPCSLDAPLAGQPEGASLADVLGQEDPAVERTLMMQTPRRTGTSCPAGSSGSC